MESLGLPGTPQGAAGRKRTFQADSPDAAAAYQPPLQRAASQSSTAWGSGSNTDIGSGKHPHRLAPRRRSLSARHISSMRAAAAASVVSPSKKRKAGAQEQELSLPDMTFAERLFYLCAEQLPIPDLAFTPLPSQAKDASWLSVISPRKKKQVSPLQQVVVPLAQTKNKLSVKTTAGSSRTFNDVNTVRSHHDSSPLSQQSCSGSPVDRMSQLKSMQRAGTLKSSRSLTAHANTKERRQRGKWGRFRSAVRTCLLRPGSSWLAWWFAAWILFLILLSTGAMVLETIPDLGVPIRAWDIVEYVSIAFFTVEVLLRMFSSINCCEFWKQPLNVVDFIAVLPFYLSLIIQAATASSANLRIFRVLRLFRLARLMKISRFMRELQLFVTVLYASMASLAGMFLPWLGVVIILSSLVYTAELGTEDSLYREHSQMREGNPFTSIPSTAYYIFTTLTTVGYGDVFPVTAWGKVAVTPTLMLGSLMLAMPLSVLAARFVALQRVEDAARHAEAGTHGNVLPASKRLATMMKAIRNRSGPNQPVAAAPLYPDATEDEQKALALLDKAEADMHRRIDLLVVALWECDRNLVLSSAFTNHRHLVPGLFD